MPKNYNLGRGSLDEILKFLWSDAITLYFISEKIEDYLSIEKCGNVVRLKMD